MANPIDIKQGKENHLAHNFIKGYVERGNKMRNIDKGTADKFGMSVESKPGAVMGRLVFKTPEHQKAFHDHMRSVYAHERDAEEKTQRNAEASHRRQRYKVYGSGHDMKQHGEGKPYPQD